MSATRCAVSTANQKLAGLDLIYKLARLAVSSVTAITCKDFGNFACKACKCGIATKQEPHQVAQNSTSTTLPFNWLNRADLTFAFSRVVKFRSGTVSPRLICAVVVSTENNRIITGIFFIIFFFQKYARHSLY